MVITYHQAEGDGRGGENENAGHPNLRRRYRAEPRGDFAQIVLEYLQRRERSHASHAQEGLFP